MKSSNFATDQTKEYRKRTLRKKRWLKVVTVLSCIVVFCTTYALILPAITMSKETYCGNDEHEHTLQCYSNPELTESPVHWEESVSGVTLTGDFGLDLISIAKSQLGYKESTENYEVQEDGETVKGYTRYGAWYGAPYSDWNALFVSFCLNYANVPSTEVPYSGSVEDFVNTLSSESFASYRSASDCTPVSGDLIFFDENGDGTADRMGILSGILSEQDEIEVIEGTNRGAVELKKYDLTDITVCGFAKLPTAVDDGNTAVAEESSISTEKDGVTVTITGQLPEGAAIHLEDVPEETLAAILAQIGTDTPVFAYDITIVDSEGKTWQPDELGATVTITGLQMPESNEEVEVAHIQDEGTIEVVDSNVIEDGVEFEAPGFSIYIGYTVDFHNEDLCFSIPGESSILLSEVFTKINLEKNAADVVAAVFSNPALLSVTQVENDWQLTSLLPFTTEEKLTLTFADGEVLEIRVTDAQYVQITSWSDLHIGDKIIIENRRHTGKYLTDETYNTNKLALKDKAYATVWTVTSGLNSYAYLRNDVTGKYLTISNGGASMTTVPSACLATNTFDSAFVWQMATNNCYLNDYDNRGTQAAGYSSGATSYQDAGARWNIYKVVDQTTAETTYWEKATELKDGETYMIVYEYSYSYTNSSNASVNHLLRYALSSLNTTTTVLNMTADGNQFKCTNADSYTQWTYNNNRFKSGSNYLTLESGLINTSSVSLACTYNTGSGWTVKRNNYNAYLSCNSSGLFSQSTTAFNRLTIYRMVTGSQTDTDEDEEDEKTGLLNKAPDHTKYIDAFRDLQDNPDTDLDDQARKGTTATAIKDLYRLYLDVGPESSYDPIDILFVIDSSTSMEYQSGGNDAKDILGYNCWRSWALDTLLNGEDPSTTQAMVTDETKHQQTTQYSNGLISMLRELNAENKIAVVRFSETSEIVQNWTTIDESTVIKYSTVKGTNYIAGLQKARALLNEVKDDGRQKIMIFLSDGIPNYYCNNLDDATVQGTISGSLISNTQNVLNNYFLTDDTFTALKNAGMEIYSIGLGDDFENAENKALLTTISNQGDPYTSTNFQEILTILDKKITRGVGHYTDLKVTDTLSEYVDFYTDNVDLLVEKVTTDQNGNETKLTLYKNGTLTTEGRNYIKENGVVYDTAAKTVSVDFLDDYEEEGNTIYRISFNVKTTQQAYTEYAANSKDTAKADGYNGIKGDDKTDYPNNETSSLKPGFYSNSSAILEYTQVAAGVRGETKTAAFDKPVIQVDTEETPEGFTEKAPDHSKYIDAFRDEEDNPDTDLDDQARNGELPSDVDIYDLYRLYLDLGPESCLEPIDVLFVVDASTSMLYQTGGNDAKDILGYDCWRSWALDTLLNGEDPATTQETVTSLMSDTSQASEKKYPKRHQQTAQYSNGLISMIGRLNSENKVAVIQFNSSATLVQDWTSVTEDTVIKCTNGSGTNYIAGLQKAREYLNQVKNDGRKKIMIFISDGIPNYYYESLDKTEQKGSTSVTEENVTITQNILTNSYLNDATFNELKAEGLEIYTIGLGKDFETESRKNLLRTIGNKEEPFNSTNFKDILTLLEKKLTCGIGQYTNLKVTDTLSDYVDFYTDNVDFLVQKITIDHSGNETKLDLYKDGTLTTDGKKYIEKAEDVVYDTKTKTVSVKFKETYAEEGNTIYRISFNVKTTQTAYDEYKANDKDESKEDGYDGVKGDPFTDYPGNTTSSEQPGFHSNASAILEYTQTLTGVGSVDRKVPYDDPVIQVKYEPSPDDPDPDDPTPIAYPVTFEHKKTIDYLNDGDENPDTDLIGEDQYRLYLDMTGKQEPVDLIIVVDGSGSMTANTDVDGMRRDAAVTKFLNGSTTVATSDGFLSYFLGLNKENRVSVVRFYGTIDAANVNYQNVSNNNKDYTYDSDVLLDWTGTNKFVNCAGKENNGTNYEAGLLRATNQLANSEIANDGHRKMMIFLSDGVPTFWLINESDVGYTYLGHKIRSSEIGRRWGTGEYAVATNYQNCIGASKRAFVDFMEANPEITVFTVAVSKDMNGTDENGSTSPTVLKYMAEKGGGEFMSVQSSMDEVKLKLQSVFYPRGVTITDNLSKYVRFLGTDVGNSKADVLVTMALKEDPTNVTVLYENGSLTKAATGILTGVEYTPGDTGTEPAGSTGTVKAIFDSNYDFKPEYTYTLSFNVETTQTAFNEFYANEADSNKKDGYDGVTGDKETDYGTNKTSSLKPGFHSNDSATVTYHVSGVEKTEQYDHPVIQVYLSELIVRKIVSGITTTDSFKFMLTVKDSGGAQVNLSGKIFPEGVTLKEGTVNVLEFNLKDGESVDLKGLIPKGSKLTLTETEHTGYSVSVKIGNLGIYGGDSQTFDINGNLEVEVTNTGGVSLPKTGGAGTRMFTLSGLILLAVAIVYGCILRRKRERRVYLGE